MSILFTKMHGLGNDFVVIDETADSAHGGSEVQIDAKLASQLCNRRFGIGADQILWLRACHDPSLDVRMEIFNADGSVAEMCGNGIRAVGLYLARHRGDAKEQYCIETLAGVQKIKMVKGTHEVLVDMGEPKVSALTGEVLKLDGQSVNFIEANVGNPHAVIFVPDVDQVLISELGPQIERHPRFTHRTNVEFVEVLSLTQLKVRVWERGAGVTLACGTGACASAAVAIALGRVDSCVQVVLPGGSLAMNWKGPGHSIFMQGPAEEVFQGKFDPSPSW